MQDLWQRYQDWLYYHSGLGLYLDISRIRFTPAGVEMLEPKLTQAFQEMAALEQGSVANPDENRMVGHYWLRTPDLAPSEEMRTGILNCITDIETFTAQVHQGGIRPPTAPRFTDLIWLGIGGSALGPQFVADALGREPAPLRVHFIDNTDPDGIDRVVQRVRPVLGSTLVGVASKSGGTPETRNGMLEIEEVYRGAGLNFADYAVAVTTPGSKLDALTQTQGWLRSFPIFDWVGGRTSELSAVGLLPAALQGIPIRGMLEGAAEMDQATRIPSLRQNPAALLAMAWYVAGEGRGLKDMVVLPYKDRLQLFSRYLQQLVMESLGKAQDLDGKTVNQGIAVYGNKGSTDQHAYVQQLRDGVNNFFLTFIEVLHDRDHDSPFVEPQVTSGDYLSGLLQGTRSALYENHRDSITVTVPDVSPRTVGALIALYERAVGLYASLIHVNAYHQPGVEAGKKAAASVLAVQTRLIELMDRRPHPLTMTELADQVGLPDQVETLYKIVRHLAANQRYVQLVGDPAQPGQLKVAPL